MTIQSKISGNFHHNSRIDFNLATQNQAEISRPILDAINTKDVRALEALLADPLIDLMGRDTDNSTALHRVVETGDDDLLNAFLNHLNGQKRDLLMARNSHGETALVSASRHGFSNAVNMLLEAGDPIDAISDEQFSYALRIAIEKNRINVLKALMVSLPDSGLNDFMESMVGEQLAKLPIEGGMIGMLRSRINLLIDQKITTSLGSETFLTLAAREGNADIVRQLIAAGANPALFIETKKSNDSFFADDDFYAIESSIPISTHEKATALLQAIENNDFEALLKLYENKESVESYIAQELCLELSGHSDSNKLSALKSELQVAFENKDFKTVLTLINLLDNKEKIKQHIENQTHALLQFSLNELSDSDDGSTALMQAIKNDHFDAANVLIAAGAAINHTLGDGNNALRFALEKYAMRLKESNQLNKQLEQIVNEYNTFTSQYNAYIKDLQNKFDAYFHTHGVQPTLSNETVRQNKELENFFSQLTHAHQQINEDIQLNQQEKSNSADLVAALITAKANINVTDAWKKTALISAAESEGLEILNILIMAGADLNQRDIHGRTALIAAANSGRLARQNLNYMLAKHEDHNPNPSWEQDIHSLQTSMEASWTIVSALISAQADLNQFDNQGRTALMLMAGAGHLEIVKTLIEAKADLGLRDKEGRTAWQMAMFGGHLDVMKACNPNGDGLDEVDVKGRTVWMGAAGRGHLDVMKEYIPPGEFLDRTDHEGRTALMLAAGGGHKAVVQELMTAKVDVNLRDHQGRSAFFLAAVEGHWDLMQELMTSNVDINLQDNQGRTALMLAAAQGNKEVMHGLINAKANLNLQDNEGRTAALHAAINNHWNEFSDLRNLGTDPDLPDNKGDTVNKYHRAMMDGIGFGFRG